MPGTISHVLSATTPDDPAFEIRPTHWNSSHLFTLNAVGSEISAGFGNAGGVTFGYDGTNVTASAPGAAGQPVNFSAGTTSNNLGSVVFSNSNGISFGLNGSTITGTVATNYQSAGAYLTTAALSGDTTKYVQNWKLTGNQAGTTSSAQGTDLWLAGGNGVTVSGSSNTLSFSVATSYLASNASTNYVQANAAFNGTNASGTIASNNISVSVAAPVVLTSWTVSDTATSATVGRLAFTAANGITMTLSTSNNGNHTVFASYTVPTVTNSSWTVSDNATSGTVARLAFTNLNGVTLSLSSGAAGLHTIVGSHNALTSQSNQAVSNSLGSFTFQTLNFSNANNVTWGTSAGGIVTASVAATVAQTNQTVGFYALGTTTGQSSSSTWDARTLSFAGAGAISIGNSSNSGLIISVPATSSLVGTSGLSVSTNASTISVKPIPLSAWDPYPILTGTAVSSHAPASFWFSRLQVNWPVAVSYANVFKSISVSAPGMSSQNSSATNKFSYSQGLTLFTRQDFAGNSTNMSQWTTASFGMTGTLSQSSSSASIALSWVTNSTGGTTSFSTTSASNNWTNFFTGLQMFRIPLVTTLTPGEYFVGQQQSSTTATVGSNFTLLSVSNLHVAPQVNSFATITSSGSLSFSSPEGQGIGVASAVTTNNTMALSVISAGTQNWWYMNFSNI